MIDVVKPKIGETIYDGAAGSAGFLCEAFDYLYYEDDQKLKPKSNLSTSDKDILQTNPSTLKRKSR